MTRDQIKQILIEEIGNIAPEIDCANIQENAELREELDIDSIGFLNLVIALAKRLSIEVPEADYRRLDTLAGAVDYLAAKAGAAENH